jgi:NAD(P)-dependent dehydrogenase (short-subunit alcohol dehydrogenase family)
MEDDGMNVVIGGASGIGAAVVEALAGETLVADLKGGDVDCDVTDRASLDDPYAPLETLAALADNRPEMAYVLAKRGVIQLVRRRSKAWGERGARIVSVSPGVIDTEMGRQEERGSVGVEDMITGSALARKGRPEEIASVVAFLCSDAASFLTGTDILVDGGAVAAFV